MFKDLKSENKTFLIVVLVAVVISVGGILLLRTMEPVPSPMPHSQALETSDFTMSEVEGWQTYRSEKFGFEFQYPSSYTINPSTDEKPCFLIARSESSCVLALTITADNNSYTPKGSFYVVDGVSSVSIQGQIESIEFDSQIKAWVSKTYLSDDTLQTWDYTNFGNEIIKTSHGGSHGSFAIYIMADHARDRVAIFEIPTTRRLRCDLMEQGSERDACENFYQSAIDEYSEGEEDTVQTWLPKGYFEAVYKDAENMISTFRFVEKTVLPNSIRTFDFKAYFDSMPVYKECLEYSPYTGVYVRHSEYYDFTKDGSEEAVVSAASCFSGTGGDDIFGIFSPSQGNIIKLPINNTGFIGDGLRGKMAFEIRDGKLIKIFPVYLGHEPNCCAEGGTREFTYEWNGKEFVISKVEDIPPSL